MGSVPVTGSVRRLIIALGASLLVHYIAAGTWRGGAPQSAVPQTAIATRLEPSQSATDVLLLRGATGTSIESSPVAVHELSNAPQRARHAVRAPQPVIAKAQAGPDTRVYLARELDRYPAPVTALSPDAGASGMPAGGIRLWVSIDQTGRVTEIEVLDTEPPAAFAAVTRERLLGTRFSPAYKDERAVKSRVLLVLGPVNNSP